MRILTTPTPLLHDGCTVPTLDSSALILSSLFLIKQCYPRSAFRTLQLRKLGNLSEITKQSPNSFMLLVSVWEGESEMGREREWGGKERKGGGREEGKRVRKGERLE